MINNINNKNIYNKTEKSKKLAFTHANPSPLNYPGNIIFDERTAKDFQDALNMMGDSINNNSIYGFIKNQFRRFLGAPITPEVTQEAKTLVNQLEQLTQSTNPKRLNLIA